MNKYKIVKVNSFRLKREDAVLVMIDFQERLMPVMRDHEDLEESVCKLVNGIKTLGVPVIVTQQYTKGLGPTVPAIAETLGEFSPIEKTDFSAAGELNFLEALNETGKTSIILCGIETHVCVAQTALILLELGYDVFLVEDAVSSRDKQDKKTAIKRMVQAGARPVSVEAVLFELLGSAKAAEFKEISRIVK
jgi:nicotinamidase-related amidase